MKKNWKNVLRQFAMNVGMFLLSVVIVIVFVKFVVGGKPVQIGSPISIEKMDDQSLWRGMVVGNAQVVGGWATVEVSNPSDSFDIFRMRVVLYEKFGSGEIAVKHWEAGQEILFHRTGVNSFDRMRGAMFSHLGLYVSSGDWKTVSEAIGCRVANPPDKK